MSITTVYKTEDGREFNTIEKAELWDVLLKEKFWIESYRVSELIESITKHFHLVKKVEYPNETI